MEAITELRTHAQDAISHTQYLVTKQRDKNTKFRPFMKGQKVWLEGTNLKLTHPTTKLAPRRYGPFHIAQVLCYDTARGLQLCFPFFFHVSPSFPHVACRPPCMTPVDDM